MTMTYQLVKNSAWKEVEVNGEMVEIPEDWSLETIKQVVTIVSGGTPSTQNPNYWNGSLTWATPVEVGRLNGMYLNDSLKKLTPLGAAQLKNKKLVRDDLIVTTRGTVGNLALAYSDMYCNQSCEALRVKANNSPQYLYFFMQTHKNQLVNNSSGTTFNAINKKNILDFFFIKPSFSEQKFIANLLTQQQTLIAKYNTLIAHHQQRLDYLSDELLSGRIRLQGGDKGEPYTMVKNTKWKEVEVNGEMVEIPEDWEVTTLPMVCKFINGSSFKPNEWSKQGTPIIRIQNLSNPKADLNYYNGNKKGLVPLKKGDILFSWSGTIDIFEYTLEAGYLNQHIFKVESLNAPHNYIKYVLRRNISNIQVNGLTMHHITLTEIRKHQVSMSNSFLEQTAIANVLTQQEKLIEQYRTLRDLEQKRFTWLSDALLSGTYRVKELP